MVRNHSEHFSSKEMAAHIAITHRIWLDKYQVKVLRDFYRLPRVQLQHIEFMIKYIGDLAMNLNIANKDSANSFRFDLIQIHETLTKEAQELK